MKIRKNYKRIIYEILVVISFILLLHLVYFFFTTPSFYNTKFAYNGNVFGGIMSVVSAIILYAAFKQNKNANNRENSFVFYQEELKNIKILEENANKDRKSNSTDHYHRFFGIQFNQDIKFENTTNYFIEIYRALNGKDFYQDLENYKNSNDWRNHNALLLNMNNIAEYIKTYVQHIAIINNEVENIRKLVKRNKLIESHSELLYTKIFSLLKDFFILVNGVDGNKNKLFEIEAPVTSSAYENNYIKPAKTKIFRSEQLMKANNQLDFLDEYENKVIKPI